MTATDELRRMLDERGVEWRGGLPTETMVEADGLDLLYIALPDGRVRAFIRNYLTPEQAVEATLGNDGAAELQTENAKLRELVRDMWHEGMCECGSRGKCARCEYGYPDRMRELGIEVDG